MTGALIVFAVLLVLLAGCQAISGDDGDDGNGDGCDWFALVAVEAPMSAKPRPAAPKAPAAEPKAPSLEKRLPATTRPATPPPMGRPSVKQPELSPTASKKPSRRHGIDLDLCD
ncbi:hypothetical protein ACIQZO_34915 [Streptomyces sp. NPDC097617]|uniref:hypothetical protein n=1 Tax=Streptomyces sp. NPDC097617 TaxID=3366091 RepID=UPI003811397F